MIGPSNNPFKPKSERPPKMAKKMISGCLSKMMGNAMMKMKNMVDSSTSKLAEMVFQGSNMGITTLTKQINDYTGEDQEVKDFAEKQLHKEEQFAESMKKYL